jgi:pSer/pThr/pTyr-binding forkhead associated (FHA) protein
LYFINIFPADSDARLRARQAGGALTARATAAYSEREKSAQASARLARMKAQLIPADGGPTIDIVKDVTVVGRQGIADVCLDSRSISKIHCVLVKTDGLMFVRDLGSTNGTRVNGQRVRRAALLPGDELALARLKFRIFLGPDTSVPKPSEKTELLSESDLRPA